MTRWRNDMSTEDLECPPQPNMMVKAMFKKIGVALKQQAYQRAKKGMASATFKAFTFPSSADAIKDII